jgi:F-type H+-transporting ATPase subunit b
VRPVAAFVWIVGLVGSSAAYAQDEPKGMPQLDFNNPLTISQVVWLAIIFFALYLLLSRWALPQVSGVLEMRASAINGDLQAAMAAKAEADAAVAELTAATRDAHATAQSEIGAAVAEAKAAAAARSAVLNEKLDAQLAAAEQSIAAARAAAMGALRQVATDTATSVIARLTGMTPDPHNVDSAIGSALDARAQS